MPMSLLTARNAIAAAVNGNMKSLGDILYALIRGEPYNSFAGDPNGNVLPQAIGDVLFDTTNSIWYRAYGLTNTSWAVDARSGSTFFAAGGTLTLTRALHNNGTILLDTLTGSVVTLPAATGTGSRFRFLVKTLATSNSHKVQVANGTDIMQGIIAQLSDNAAAMLGWAAGAADDTVTLNRSTTGSVFRGEYLEIVDAAAGVFLINGIIGGTGTEATPFTSAV